MQAPVYLTQCLLSFIFKSLLYVLVECALSLWELYDTVVALRYTFLVILSIGGLPLAHAMLRC
jgi:hypothetical protein